MSVSVRKLGPGDAEALLAAEVDHALRLYEQSGFRVWGVGAQAMCVEGRFAREYHMWLSLGDQAAR